MAILSKDEILDANKRPDPLIEEHELADLGGAVRIEGIRGYDARTAIDTDVAHFYDDKGNPPRLPHPSGEMFTPVHRHIVAACWAAACVKDPALTSTEWLFFACKNPSELVDIFNRCLVCSRLAEDTKTVDGVEAAKAGLQESGDPLVSGS